MGTAHLDLLLQGTSQAAGEVPTGVPTSSLLNGPIHRATQNIATCPIRASRQERARERGRKRERKERREKRQEIARQKSQIFII